MRLAFNVSPINNANKVRGIGAYTESLLESMEAVAPALEITTFSGGKIPDSDIIHYPYFDLFFHTLPITKQKPRVVTVHDVIPLIFPKHYPVGIKGKVNFYLQILSLKNSDAIICDSLSSKNDIVRKLGYPADKIFPIYLAASKTFKPVNKETAKKVAKKYKLPDEFLVYVGDVNWNKNISGLLRAIKEVKVNLVLVGKALVDNNLNQTKQINEQISALNVQQKVFKTGYVSATDLCAIYNLAQATVVPSFYEGFGLPVVESLACGTPVICSNKSSMPEIAGDKSIYFNPESDKSVIEALNKFLSLSEPKLNIIRKSATSQSRKFSWHKTAEETINVYKKISEN